MFRPCVDCTESSVTVQWQKKHTNKQQTEQTESNPDIKTYLHALQNTAVKVQQVSSVEVTQDSEGHRHGATRLTHSEGNRSRVVGEGGFRLKEKGRWHKITNTCLILKAEWHLTGWGHCYHPNMSWNKANKKEKPRKQSLCHSLQCRHSTIDDSMFTEEVISKPSPRNTTTQVVFHHRLTRKTLA